MISLIKRSDRKHVAVCATFTTEDTRNARAWLVGTGTEGVSARGRVSRTHLMQWHNMNRPELAKPERIEFSESDKVYARRWYAEHTDSENVRASRAICLAWVAAGAPEIAAPMRLSATIEYHGLDTLGRFNPRRRMEYREVMIEQLASTGGRPSTQSYIDASGLTRDMSRITRIVTARGALHSVKWIEDKSKYALRWESKRDQSSVMVALLKTITQYRDLAVEHGIDTSAIDAQAEHVDE